MKKLLIAALLAASSIVSAQGIYGGNGLNQSGNTYNSTGNGYTGHNDRTGSTWNAQTQGSTTTGIDSRGNSWSYDRSSGQYQNYGTGETRSHGKRSTW